MTEGTGMHELEFCKVCGSTKPVDGVCDYCYDKLYEELREKYERVVASGGPKKNLDSE